MLLLNESKRIWLLSYVILMMIACILCIFLRKLPIYRTIGLMSFGMLAIMLVEFFLVVKFEWITWRSRIVVSLLYLGGTILGGIKGCLCKWYIIIPLFLIMEIYHLWNMGGIINCLIVSPYKERINDAVSKAKDLYEQYLNGIDEFNLSNQLLNVFTRVKINKEPNWIKLSCNINGIDMFWPPDALLGISALEWRVKEKKVLGIISKLYDKNEAIYSNKLVREEHDMLNQIVRKGESIGVHNAQLSNSMEQVDSVRRKRIKKEKKVLKRRL